MIRKRLFARAAVALSVVGALALAGCSGSGTAQAQGTMLNVYNGASGAFVENWNPFSPTVLADVQGMVYEPLFYYNTLDSLSTKPKPVLGKSFSWNAAGTELTVTMGDGAKWSDGTPVTAKDVAFTMNLIRTTSSLNTTGNAPSAVAKDDNTVTLTFKHASFVDGPTFLGRTYIVPEHIWKDVKDPAKTVNKNPIGSGPLAIGVFSSQSYTLKKNTKYRDADKVEVGGIRVYSLSGNQAATDKLLAGQLDWAGIFIPDMKKVLATKPNLGWGVSSSQQVVLTTCSNAALGCSGPQTDVAVRQAIAAAMNRNQVNKLAYYGLGTPISATYGLQDRDKDFIAKQYADPEPMTPDVDKAQSLLEQDGWAKGSDGIYAKDRQRLSIKVNVTTGYTDYIATLDTLREQLKQAGIEIVPQQVANSENTSSQGLGKFQMAISGLFQGAAPDPYYVYNNFFNGATTAKVGESVNPYGNVARFQDPKVDAALAKAAGTPDQAQKAAAYADIQASIVKTMPYIPVINVMSSAEFNTTKVTGFPQGNNQYASTNPNSAPDNAQVLTRLKLKK